MTDTAPQHTHTLGDRVDMTREELFHDYRDVGTLKDWFYDWHGLNEWLFLQINSIREPYYDQLMQFISHFGNYRHFLFWLAGILVYALASLSYRKIRKKGAVRGQAVMWVGVFVVLLVGFAANGIMVKTMKEYFEFPRPYVALAQDQVNLLQVREAEDGMKSFPSGHVAFITFIIASLWPAFRDDWRKWALLPIALVGWSRVSLGVHFPADVIWSCLLTTLLIIIVRKICYFLLHKLFRLTC
jgi:membrane-associated phospholipid phosphatase